MSSTAPSVAAAIAVESTPQAAYAALKASLQRLEAAVKGCVARASAHHEARIHALEAEVAHWQQSFAKAHADNTALRTLLRDAAAHLAESSQTLGHVMAQLPPELHNPQHAGSPKAQQGVLHRIHTGDA